VHITIGSNACKVHHRVLGVSGHQTQDGAAETELAELILQQVDYDKEIKFLEISNASGAFSLSLLKEPPKVNT
jgi:hypothetical protein